MALPVRENASPLSRIHDEIDRMFQDFTSNGLWSWRDASRRLPALDVYEKDGNLVVEAELPGIDKNDLEVTHTEDAITIQGITKREKDEKKEGYHHSERRYASYHREVPLPQAVDFTQAKAELKDGVLTVTVPKAEKREAPARTIPVSG